ncbi:hypothetical protein AX774_g1955 [Zancudomyces culisetae]|uniref:PI31 proteasome regulator C-terminal domain-containing protein n=1 Tax=Zancudomyces culisetae TaxID=1213189 RepID=A0A1R1PU81_ZANCU|nr:hypothetical protein AX774_g3432 [Zancudomyces culisetae]OMH84511.1 hypothetical protein AX774_g1955 [Zancudomyces culisetae]|eukprot:OMH83062.1 hypothetical protein AX774_g3432 [Zancudomyces culisetae]
MEAKYYSKEQLIVQICNCILKNEGFIFSKGVGEGLSIDNVDFTGKQNLLDTNWDTKAEYFLSQGGTKKKFSVIWNFVDDIVVSKEAKTLSFETEQLIEKGIQFPLSVSVDDKNAMSGVCAHVKGFKGFRRNFLRQLVEPHFPDEEVSKKQDVSKGEAIALHQGRFLQGFGEGVEGGGSIVGPNHPIFGPRGQRHDSVGSGIPGGPQTLPRGAVPPGARFDPIVPFGNIPGIRKPGNRGGTFSGDPDKDEFMPPNGPNFF